MFLVARRLIPTCLSMSEYEEMPLAMTWISTSVSAISAPTALRIKDSRKPAPATSIMEAKTLLHTYSADKFCLKRLNVVRDIPCI